MEAADMHRRLVAAVRSCREAERRAVELFAEMLYSRAYTALGHSNIYDYATESFGFSKSKTAHWISLSRAMRQMPALRGAVQRQELEWSKAVEVARAATPVSARRWVQVAKQSTRKELRRKIRSARLGLEEQSPPTTTRISHTVTAAQFARYERAMERLRKKGSEEAELLIQALESFAGETPKGVTLILHECKRCKETIARTTRGDLRIPNEQARQLRCEATLQEQGKHRRQVTPSMRRRVLERDGHRCRQCRSPVRLQIHHIHQQNQGGSHEPNNLLTLCQTCHGMIHRGIGGNLPP